MLLTLTKTILMRKYNRDLATRISIFIQSLLRLIVHYLEFLWPEHLDIISFLFTIHSPLYVEGQENDQVRK